MSKRIKRMLAIMTIVALGIVSVNIAGFMGNDTNAYAKASTPKTTYTAYAHCKKCDPKKKHVYVGKSTKSTNDACKNAKKKCAKKHNKKSCRIIVTTQY